MKKLTKELLKYSKENDLAHIPSALSHLEFLDYLYTNKYVIPYEHNIVIGKPFGAQAYYLIWKKLSYLKDIENLSYGVKHSEIDFVNFSEETLGNALGIASGIELSNKKPTWVHLSDAAFQMGSTLEALQFISKHKQNIIITVDSNEMQLTGNTYDVLGLDSVFIASFSIVMGIETLIIKDDYSKIESFLKKSGPKMLVFKTKKGNDVPEMEMNPIYWHYKKWEGEIK